jgi:hypothetical protein
VDVNNTDVNNMNLNMRKDMDEKPEKRDVMVNINIEGEYDRITYFIRQSSAKTEAVARYVE